MQPSLIAEFTMRRLLYGSKDKHRGAIRRWAFSFARKMLAQRGNRCIRYTLSGSEILVPLAHDLPLIRSTFPQYSANIARLCGYVSKKFPDLHMIDIGANIGDTVAIVREHSRCPILCVEADEYYFSLLTENIQRANLQCVEAVRAFVATYTGELKGHLTSGSGSARYVDEQSNVLHAIRLSRLLEEFPEFQRSKILKIDTDGFDCSILRSELEWLREKRPMIFFEYDPFFFHHHSYDGALIFKDLSEAGYTFAIFYDNVGDYLTSVDLQCDKRILTDLQNYYVGKGGHQYLDVAVFHDEDRDIADYIRIEEAKWSVCWKEKMSKIVRSSGEQRQAAGAM
jgi:FkbM family methyltransferase